MDSKVKDFLYAWLGKQKQQPVYNTSAVNGRGVQRFKCELRVQGHGYVGVGNSLNKKDAATNAAMDFCQYLVRKGLLQENEIPSLSMNSLEATSVPSGGTMFKEEVASVNGDTDGSVSTTPFHHPSKSSWGVKSSFEQYIHQKAEEVAQSESVDFRSELHGGWTMENSKCALNEFVQKLKQKPPTYITKQTEGGHASTFSSEASIFLPQVHKQISGRGQGSNKKVAEAQCSVSIVRQLFHMKLIKAFNGERKKKDSSHLPEISVPSDVSLFNRVRSFLDKCGVVPADPDEEATTPEVPISILLDCSLASFPDSDVYPAGNISWSPPLQNWNPWRASNIDRAPLAFMSMADISADLSREESQKKMDEQIQLKRDLLPVFGYKKQLIETIQSNSVTLIKGETGCGKSTQVAQYLLEHYIELGRGAEFNAFVSQPRRISAISLAERVAVERSEELGLSVGYGVRFESVSPRPYGAIMFCTVGVLLRKMESGLRGVSHIIIDEIHERDINTDFILVVLREMVREYSDIRIILMSATIDTKLFSDFFGDCPIIEMTGRTFAVKQFFLEDIIRELNFMPPIPEKRKDEDSMNDETKNLNIALPDDTAPFVRQAMQRLNEKEIPFSVVESILNDIDSRGVEGSVLIFLPGWNEIQALMTHLKNIPAFANPSRYIILPLHSQLTGKEQRRVFDHFGSARKIILSTNIAETSVTIDDVVFVIDSCRAKEKLYTSHNNMVHFATVWASRTNITQRKGRAGRVKEGYAFTLCTRARYDSLEEHRTAEIMRTPLHEIALTIKLLRLGSIGDFLGKAIEVPPVDTIIESEVVLREMGALDKNSELTDLGKIIARMPIEPILGKTIVMATVLGIGGLMCDVAASSSFSPPFVALSRLSSAHRSFAGRRWSDHIALVSINQAYRENCDSGGNGAETNFCDRYSLSNPILKMTTGAKRQMVDILMGQCGFPEEILYDKPVNVNGNDEDLDLLTSLLVMAMYPNVCFYKEKRKVITLEQASALLSKASVLIPFKDDEFAYPSPLFVFTEKLRTRVIACKELTVISAIQLLLFGSRKVECIGKDMIRLDDMIPLKMSVSDAAAVVALRPCVEALLIRSCQHPESLSILSDDDKELCSLLRELSSEKFMANATPQKDDILADDITMGTRGMNRGRGRGGFSRGRGGFRGGWKGDGGGRGGGNPMGGYGNSGDGMGRGGSLMGGYGNSGDGMGRGGSPMGGYGTSGDGMGRGGYGNSYAGGKMYSSPRGQGGFRPYGNDWRGGFRGRGRGW